MLAKLTIATLAVTGSTFVASAVPVSAVADVTETFSAASAFTAAARSGHPVEILAQKSATTRIWAQPSGRVTAEVAAAPVRLQRDGRWLDYDMTLQRRPDGTVAPRVHPHDLVLSAARTGGEHDLATVNAAGERQGLGWAGLLPEPVLAGAKATYPEIAPGIDLVLQARPGGFEQYFVVKQRSAAARVPELRVSMRGNFQADAEGNGRWTDANGKVTGRMPTARMWDSQGLGQDGEHKRQTRVKVQTAQGRTAGQATIAADQAWLLDASTSYPVMIDPGYEVERGVGFDEFTQNTISVSDNQSSAELKVGYSDSSDCMAESSQGCRTRSYLRFDGLSNLAGATVFSARLRLWAFHSWSCTQYGWYVTRTDPVAGWVQWGNEPARSGTDVGAVSMDTLGHSSSCNDGWVSADIAPIMNTTFANGWDSASMVVRAVGDNDSGWAVSNHNSWKKFDSAQSGHPPVISIEYDRIPTISNAAVEADATCGVGTAYRKYLTTDQPAFSARVNDGDPYHVGFQIAVDDGVTTAYQSVLNGAPGGVLSLTWPSQLAHDKIYTWRIRALDQRADGSILNYGPWSQPCEIGFDADTISQPPIVEGLPTIVEEGVTYPILKYGQAQFVTFRPEEDDADKVKAYRWGFSQAAVESPNAPTAPAGPDGTATVPVIRWDADSQGEPLFDAQLFVRAVTITGAQFSTKVIDVYNHPPEPKPQVNRVANDVNGDGVAELMGYRQIADNQGLIYALYRKPDGTLTSPAHLLKVPYNDANSEVVKGDFNGDGTTDLAAFVRDGANDVVIKLMRSNGNGLTETEVWSSLAMGAAHAGKWNVDSLRVFAGDANADGKADLIVAHGNGTASWSIKVFAADATDFAEPVQWSATMAANLNNLRLVAGEFNNAAGAELASFSDVGGCRTVASVYPRVGTGAQFGSGVTAWDSGAGNWCLFESRFASGDMAGSGGLDGVVGYYDYGNCKHKVFAFQPVYDPSYRWHQYEQWDGNAAKQFFCSSLAEFDLPDLTGDGKADLVMSYKCCNPHQQQVWQFTSSGTGTSLLADPVKRSTAPVGPLGVGPKSNNPNKDINNDGHADLAIFYGFDNAAVSYQVAYGHATGMPAPTQVWGLPAYYWERHRVKHTGGDYNGDGYYDSGFLYVYADGSAVFMVTRGSATGMSTNIETWWSKPAGTFDLNGVKVEGGDFNGDGFGDIGIYNGTADSAVQFHIGYGNAGGMAAATVQWSLGIWMWERDRVKISAGDYNGDGRDDIAIMYNYADYSVWVQIAYDGINRVHQWSLAPGSWDGAAIKMESGDFDGNGFDDLGIFYGHSNMRVDFIVSYGHAGGLAYQQSKWSHPPGSWERDRVRFTVADYDGDGRDDAGFFYSYADWRVWFMVYKGGVESAGTLWELPAGSWDPNAPALN